MRCSYEGLVPSGLVGKVEGTCGLREALYMLALATKARHLRTPNPHTQCGSRRYCSGAKAADVTKSLSISRHFIGIFPPVNAIDQIVGVQNALQELQPGLKLRWVPRENIHLTVQFLGGALQTVSQEEQAQKVRRLARALD